MKLFASFGVVSLSILVSASDHNNLEPSRPLSVEDAYSIAYGEREIQMGFSAYGRSHDRPLYGLRSEFQYGFAKNRDFSLAFESLSPHAPTSFEASYFENLNRETERSPALGYRVSALQTGSQSNMELTLAATKAWHQYDKLHANIGLDSHDAPKFIIGYSSPLGYPRQFDLTAVGELVYQNGVGSIGVGLRRQVSAQGVIDLGVTSGGGLSRLVFGYSFGF